MTDLGLTRSSVARRLTDAMVGDRLRAAIDRRVRRGTREARHSLRTELLAQLRRELRTELNAGLDAEFDRRTDPRDAARRVSLEVLFGERSSAERLLDPARFDRLGRELGALTGQPVSWPMQQAYRLLLASEWQGLGRIAGSTYNIVGKLTAPPLLDPPPGPVLEIGSLFGLFSPALVQQFRRAGQFRNLTVVDPWAGHQVQPGTASPADPTGTPVLREVAEHNLRTALPAEISVVQGFSTDDEVRAEVAMRTYAVVIIDGDHSADGVYADLWWVETIASPGAVVVMDDFGDPKWPGVEAATRRYLAEGGAMHLLGTASTSAYLRMP